MEKRTLIKFERSGDLWPIVKEWAEENKFKPKEEIAGGKIYQKGVGFLVAPMMLKVEQNGASISMEAWIRANLFVRAMALFILPAEMALNSGGIRGAAPRAIARKAVNRLLSRLGQNQID